VTATGVRQASSADSPQSWSVRSSTERDSWRDSGAAESLERHSQGKATDVRPTLLEGCADVCWAGVAGGVAFVGLQQQTVHARLRQQARGLAPPLVDAFASLTIDSNPRIVTKAIEKSRRC
jgi:hypothetical protein